MERPEWVFSHHNQQGVIPKHGMRAMLAIGQWIAALTIDLPVTPAYSGFGPP
jgi:hypothetical protein